MSSVRYLSLKNSRLRYISIPSIFQQVKPSVSDLQVTSGVEMDDPYSSIFLVIPFIESEERTAEAEPRGGSRNLYP
ncbi:hypothetical protein V2H45_22680 [Tumidithrix elongata RA019]|uniref:Uncharacterized protein n=1 Tax=Tumidithrix elongata BACA0141 TaxID=2716417 RepID=A0AAW9Q4U9_9CYAN|nr:hypothetical protein [Tumidithrix elongata RA019]